MIKLVLPELIVSLKEELLTVINANRKESLFDLFCNLDSLSKNAVS